MGIKSVAVFFVCVLLSVSELTYAQSVMFSGQITRHQAGNINESVRGSVFIHYGDTNYLSNEATEINTIEVPFFIPAGQKTTSYQKQVDWSLAGSIKNSHNYFRVSIKCNYNCKEANALDDFAFSYEGAKTIYPRGLSPTDQSQYRIEKYGEDLSNRNGGYLVNMSLLPKYAYVEGLFLLPKGLKAPADLNLELIGLDAGYSSKGAWGQPFYQLLSFPVGKSEVKFRFQIDLLKLTQRRNPNFTFGYQCLSAVCKDMGLVSGAILDSDGDRFYSNILDLWSLGGLNFPLSSEDSSFVFKLPKPIAILEKFKKTITIIHNKNKEVGVSLHGRVVVQKTEMFINCTSSEELDFSSKERCDFNGHSEKKMVVSNTPFIINKGQEELIIDIPVEESEQIISNNSQFSYNRLDYQIIKIECDQGCESQNLIRSGYYRKNHKATSSSEDNAKQFLVTKDFDQPIIISLKKNTNLPHINFLLLEE